jgi:hypothetical protein
VYLGEQGVYDWMQMQDRAQQGFRAGICKYCTTLQHEMLSQPRVSRISFKEVY